MTSKFGKAAVAATAALFLAAATPAMAQHHGFHGHGGFHGHHGFHHGGHFGAGIAGFAAGALLGGALASQPYYYGPDYYPEYDYAPAPAYGPSVAWCEQHYRSYDPRSGTYLGYDGLRHPCP
jgi:BA14K-like protein